MTQNGVWAEKNCYLDLWIELLHSLDLEPLAAAACAIGGDFELDQWTFLKFAPEDLRRLYGIEVAELTVWRPVLDHVAEHLAAGRLLTIEVDSYFLPDTDGLSYRTSHTKSTIVPHRLDRDARRLEYFHNAGYFELLDDDFDGVFGLGDHARPDALVPYVEVIRFDRLRRITASDLAAEADNLLTEYLQRRPTGNPVLGLAQRISMDSPWLAGDGRSQFHDYAFSMCRQFGAGAELGAAFSQYLIDYGRPDPTALHSAEVALQSCAEAAKALQFALARTARGRSVDLSALLERMTADWQHATDALYARTHAAL